MFTISESWLDASVSYLEIEVPGYNIYRVDRSHLVAGFVHTNGEISGISSTGFHQLWLKPKVNYYLHCL